MAENVHKGGRTKGDGKGKSGGRKAGSVNKVTRVAKEIICGIVNDNAEKAQKMLDKVSDPKDWITCFVKLAEFVVPKQAAVSVTAEVRRCDLRSELADLLDREED